MTNLADTFTATTGTLLPDHAADSGHTWTYHPNSGVPDFVITNNRLRCSADTGVVWAYNNYVPPTADYTVAADLVCLTAINQRIGLSVRCATDVATELWCTWENADTTWKIRQGISGVGSSVLGSTAGTFTDGQTKRMRVALVGTSVSLYVDDVLTVEGTTDITDAGAVAVKMLANDTPAAGTGFHYDNLEVTTVATTTVTPGVGALTWAGYAPVISVSSPTLTLSEPQYAAVAAASSGANTLVAAVVGSRIRVIALALVASGGTNSVWLRSAAAGRAITGTMDLGDNAQLVMPYNPAGWCETVAGELLNLQLSDANAVAGVVTYVLAEE